MYDTKQSTYFIAQCAFALTQDTIIVTNKLSNSVVQKIMFITPEEALSWEQEISKCKKQISDLMELINEKKLDGNVTERIPSMLPRRKPNESFIITKNKEKYFDHQNQMRDVKSPADLVLSEFIEEDPLSSKRTNDIPDKGIITPTTKAKEALSKTSNYILTPIKIGPSPIIKHVTGLRTFRYKNEEGCGGKSGALSSCDVLISINNYSLRETKALFNDLLRTTLGKIQVVSECQPVLKEKCISKVNKIDSLIASAYAYSFPISNKKCINNLKTDLRSFEDVIRIISISAVQPWKALT